MQMASLKHQIKRCLLASAGKLRLLDLAERRLAGGVTILTYHRVLPDDQCAGYPMASLVMPVSAFRKQVQWLAGNCTVLPVREAMRANRTNDHRPVVCVTFDDGYADNFPAAGVLEEHGCRGTFFVTAGLIGTGELLWFDRAAGYWQGGGGYGPVTEVSVPTPQARRLCYEGCAGVPAPRAGSPCHQAKCASHGNEVWSTVMEAGTRDGDRGECPRNLAGWMAFLKRLEPATRGRVLAALERRFGRPPSGDCSLMSVDQVVDLHRRGHEIGSHTMTHPLLPQLSDGDLRDELQTSREMISKWIGAAIPGFCYPNGDGDDRVVAVTRAAGYRYACTTRSGINRPGQEPLRLLRIHVHPRHVLSAGGEHDELGFRAELCGLFRYWK